MLVETFNNTKNCSSTDKASYTVVRIVKL